MQLKKLKTAYAAALKGLVIACLFSLNFISPLVSYAGVVTSNTGGGYAATGQMNSVGYTSHIYDAANGLPTSDANCVLAASDGFIWIGGYSGILRYDGRTFTRMDTANGLTNGRCLFEDSLGRIWVGTNDNGVVVIDGNDQTHLTYADGLMTSSIRDFAEDNDGNIFVGTTDGVYRVNDRMEVAFVDDDRINEERILRLDAGVDGTVYGQTKSGLIFSIKDQKIAEAYTGEDLGLDKICAILADPEEPGEVYIGTEADKISHGRFGDTIDNLSSISTEPLGGIHWLSFECGRLWISSTEMTGYLDERDVFHQVTTPLISGIEMMTSDYQGNMWFASSTQGVMKIVTNNFVDLTKEAGLPETVTNTTCLYHDKLFIGTDRGLTVLDKGKHELKNELTYTIGETRIRCIVNGADDDLWIGAYSNYLGLVHVSKDGSISIFSKENGMPDNEIRSIDVAEDGTVLVGTNAGLAVIKDGKVTRSVGAEEGIKNTVFLTVEDGGDGVVYAGTDGDGIYVIDGDDISHLEREDGLTSDVVMRIKRDDDRGVFWLVTSNSIQYMKDGVIHSVSTFPYNNNYDIYFNKNDDMWIVSSYGLYEVGVGLMIADDVSDYRLYTTENGLTGTPTSLSYSALSEDGYLYIPVRNGVSRVNIDRFSENEVPVKVAIDSVYCGDTQILPDENGNYTLPSNGGRIRITPAVLDYTMLNPEVKVYMEGKEDEGISVARSKLQPLDYTGLSYGDYKLHISVMDQSGKYVVSDEQFNISKRPEFAEMMVVRIIFLLFIALIAGFIVWRVMKSTVIRRQLTEIRQARDEAERASTAKSRFLANMSQEILTPINTILGMNEMAMREDATGVPQPYFMAMMNYAFDIRSASESLLSLINAVLDISKIESDQMTLEEQEYDVQEMLKPIVFMIRTRSTEKNLMFNVEVDEILPKRLYGDQGKVRQIILNLLGNAVKYTNTGSITLKVSMDGRVDDECSLKIAVEDTGIGIKKEDADKLFNTYDRFAEQKDVAGHGAGLGLEISRRFADLMGGNITLESEYGEGSVFTLSVKQRIVDKTPIGVFSEHDDSSIKGPYVPQFVAPDADILVVDDNPMNLNVIKNLLKSTKVFVSTAGNGEECLEKIKDTKFNVVLLDQMMPGMDGIETVARIREKYPDLPVYALTASSNTDEGFYRSKGFNGYLRKPIDSLMLEKTIMRHLPEAMMEKPAVEVSDNDIKEIPDDLKWLYDTEGLYVDDGIKNTHGIPHYLFALKMFFDTIDSNAAAIRESYESGDIGLFILKIHSLRSSARIVGANDLVRLADEMEDAGRRDDRAFIDDNAHVILEEYESFKEKLAGLK